VTIDRILGWFISFWCFVVFVLLLADFTGIMRRAPTIWSGVSGILDEISPTNYKLFITLLIFLSPALLALWWRERRRRKQTDD